MSYQQGTRWAATAAGGMELQLGDGTVLLTISNAGAVTYGAAVTVNAVVLPSLTATERNALADVAGSIIFNETSGKLNFNTGSGWEAVTSAAV